MSDDETTVRARQMVAETPKLPEIDVNERAGDHTGNPRSLDRRLFMQLLVYRVEPPLSPDAVLGELTTALRDARCPGVLYRDVNDPRSLGLLTWSVDPAHFVTTVRGLLLDERFRGLTLREDFTMLGRSYATGYESDLAYWLLERPVENAVNPEHRWAVWYPLRRAGAFERLTLKEQAGILREHAAIGRAYGEQGLATDIRLACHGLDAKDNEFVIGLVAKDLHPLSHLVQRMRKTQQTSEYIQQMGPFFVGYAVWQQR
jgi:chlorite dismutase